MKQGIVNWKLAAASAVVLAVMMAITVAQAGEPKSLSSQQVKALVANANTPADHMRLAHYYAAKAEKHEADATEHEALAAEYTRTPRLGASKHPMGPETAEHCKYYAEHCRKAAKEMREMSAAHEKMAKGT